MKIRRYLLLLPVLFFITPLVVVALPAGDSLWSQQSEVGAQEVNLYFYWSAHCPHCLEAKPVVERWQKELPWLVLHSREVTENAANLAEYREMAGWFVREARSVPAFFYCGKMEVGFDNEAGMGSRIRNELERCHQLLSEGRQPVVDTDGPDIRVPLLGHVQAGEHSLLLVTTVIAALDAFNPCAFFVLLFLLSLLIHTRSRRRMFFVGSVFIFFSGAVYFLFMSAWLNLFLLLGVQQLFTLVAGLVALTLSLINIKDFLLPGKGLSLSMTAEEKSSLFQRMRGLLQQDNMVAVTFATVALAVAANSYELLCTSGLPMVYTRILTLEALSTDTYYLYLLLYNIIYVVPLLLILLVFTQTLGQRKLQPEEGQLLKLLSGIMMFELGVGLLLKPELLGAVAVVAAGMLSAILLTVLAWWVRRDRLKGGRRD